MSGPSIASSSRPPSVPPPPTPPPPGGGGEQSTRPKGPKQLACDPCRQRKVRCVRTGEDSCVGCTSRGIGCTTSRQYPVPRKQRTGRRIEEARALFGGEPVSSPSPPPRPSLRPTPTPRSLPTISTNPIPTPESDIFTATTASPDPRTASSDQPSTSVCDSPSSAAAPAFANPDRPGHISRESSYSKGDLRNLLNPAPDEDPRPHERDGPGPSS